MKPYPVRYKCVRNHRKTRCVNPHCGKWVDIPADNPVCPLCGSKQRLMVELRGLKPENLTACAHLLHQARPDMDLAECRKQCRSITAENPYRLSFAGKPERIRPFVREWNALQGSAAACFEHETGRRPVVLIRSYNRKHTKEHARLLSEAFRKTDLSSMDFGETVAVLHGIIRTGKPYRLQFTSDFDHIDEWIAAWRSLGGTAVRSMEHA